MQHPYKAVITMSGTRGKASGEIFEGEIQIGTFNRPAKQGHYIAPITYKFFSTASRARFEDFADCLTIEETIEALAF